LRFATVDPQWSSEMTICGREKKGAKNKFMLHRWWG